MNDDHIDERRVHAVLSDGLPPAPAPTGWAATAARRSSARRAGVGVAALLAVIATPAALLLSHEPPVLATPANPASPSPSTASPLADPANPPPVGEQGEVFGAVAIFQDVEDEFPHLCVGAVRQSLPPQCDGPLLTGDFSWDAIPHSEYSGVRWTDETVLVVGRLDLDEGERGSFTLSRALGTVPSPSPWPTPDRLPTHSPRYLCDDPMRDADPGNAPDVWGMVEVDGEKTASDLVFARTLDELPVVDWWGSSEDERGFQVLVRGDAEAAHRTFREVYGGPLCVASSDLPTLMERQAALKRVLAVLPSSMVLESSRGIGSTLRLHLVVADEAIEKRIDEAAGEGIDVHIVSVFTPYGG
ncbi:MAG TPA: hypothetical protein PKE40_01820 [Arachnia sp.]|nr:hypothetical protein [Arachnia sp.]HMT85066.1 hypothetical protein [Arachnia sp.]